MCLILFSKCPGCCRNWSETDIVKVEHCARKRFIIHSAGINKNTRATMLHPCETTEKWGIKEYNERAWRKHVCSHNPPVNYNDPIAARTRSNEIQHAASRRRRTLNHDTMAGIPVNTEKGPYSAHHKSSAGRGGNKRRKNSTLLILKHPASMEKTSVTEQAPPLDAIRGKLQLKDMVLPLPKLSVRTEEVPVAGQDSSAGTNGQKDRKDMLLPIRKRPASDESKMRQIVAEYERVAAVNSSDGRPGSRNSTPGQPEHGVNLSGGQSGSQGSTPAMSWAHAGRPYQGYSGSPSRFQGSPSSGSGFMGPSLRTIIPDGLRGQRGTPGPHQRQKSNDLGLGTLVVESRVARSSPQQSNNSTPSRVSTSHGPQSRSNGNSSSANALQRAVTSSDTLQNALRIANPRSPARYNGQGFAGQTSSRNTTSGSRGGAPPAAVPPRVIVPGSPFSNVMATAIGDAAHYSDRDPSPETREHSQNWKPKPGLRGEDAGGEW